MLKMLSTFVRNLNAESDFIDETSLPYNVSLSRNNFDKNCVYVLLNHFFVHFLPFFERKALKPFYNRGV